MLVTNWSVVLSFVELQQQQQQQPQKEGEHKHKAEERRSQLGLLFWRTPSHYINKQTKWNTNLAVLSIKKTLKTSEHESRTPSVHILTILTFDTNFSDAVNVSFNMFSLTQTHNFNYSIFFDWYLM
jgi:hypothetical protein